jgi:ATP synthase protein I
MPILPPGQLKDIGLLSTIGLSFVLAIAIGVAVGVWIDRTFDTSPWGFLVFFFLGVAAAILNVYRTLRQTLK